MRSQKKPQGQQDTGVALLAVLWLAVALSAMALATSYLVRTEVEAVRNQVEATRSYFLARGGIEAAMDSIVRSAALPQPGAAGFGPPPEFLPGQRWLRYEFPGGRCVVEVMPEDGKLNVNLASPEQLAALFLALGLPAPRNAELAAALVDWRSPRASDAGTIFDAYYSGLPQPYRARHAPLEQIEEMLPVRGMSRDLLFGYGQEGSPEGVPEGPPKGPEGKWQRRPPLADLLTTEGAQTAVNPSYAPYEVLRALPGWDDAMARAVVAKRATVRLNSWDDLLATVPELASVAGTSPLTFKVGPVYTLTATGYLPDSSVRRSVRALVWIAPNLPLYHRILGWWNDWPFAQEPPQEILNQDTGGRVRS